MIPGFVGTERRQPWPLRDLAPGFLDHLRDERGLRPDTLVGYEHHMRVFERFLQSAAITDLFALTPAFVNRFLVDSTARLSPGARQSRAGALRVLLRYLHRQGILAADLSRAVPRGRTYKQAAIPRAIPWSDVERVLASVDRRSACGKRDYAVLMLLATYGLRSQEIAALSSRRSTGVARGFTCSAARPATRRPIHWRRRSARRSSTICATPVPSAQIATCSSAWRPHFAASGLAISGRASVYLRRAGITVRRPGSHTFRHSCVQRLVEADVPFKQIGDYVGHRSDAATQVYAKVAIHKLRALTLGDAEDVL